MTTAWLDSDNERIRKYLGFPVTAASKTRIQGAQNTVAGVSTDAIATCQTYLRELDKIWQQINETRPFAGVASYSTSGSSTDYYPGQRMAVQRAEGRRYVSEVAELLELPIIRDVFVEPRSNNQMIR